LQHVSKVIFVVFSFLALFGCTKRQAPSMLSGDVLSRAALYKSITGGAGMDDSYAVVRADWLTWAYSAWRSDLSKEIVKWDERFDCNRFALDFIAWTHRRFLVDEWHTSVKAQAASVHLFCYNPTPTTAHAVVFINTDRGEVFLEVQTGKHLTLSHTQRQSRFSPSL
jgi:hypothetical protein